MGDEPPPEEDEEQETYAFNYGKDWPAAFGDMGSIMLGGRPTNHTLGPLQQQNILIAAAPYRAPTPRRAGKGKPLPASDYEGEQETTQRKKTQKEAQRLILPKVKEESPDHFIRRLDAHKHAPTALVAPMNEFEAKDDSLFAKRMMAIKETADEEFAENHLILPKGPKEQAAQFEQRLAAAKKQFTIIMPIGAHESPGQWEARLKAAKKSRRIIMPKGEKEPDKGFSMRLEMAASCEWVVHPYDPDTKRQFPAPGGAMTEPAAETEAQYYRRLQACKERTALVFEPGDLRAIEKAIGPEQVHKEEAPPSAAPSAADVAAAAMAESEAENAKTRAAEEEEEKRKAAEKAEAEAAKSEEESMKERLEQMKIKQEEERKRQEEEEAAKGFDMEKINIKTIGFMPLKKLLQERGVPKEQIFGCSNKVALMEVAKKWGDELKIQWTED